MASAAAAPARQPEAGGGGSFLGKAGPLVIARLISAVLTVSIPLVLARQLNLHEYGSYKQLFLIFMTLYMVLPFGVGQSMYFFVPRNGEQARSYFGQTMVWLLGMSVVACSLLFAFEDDVARLINSPDLIKYKWELALYTAGLVGSSPLELWFTCRGKTKLSAVTYLVSDTTRALALVIPVLLGYGLHGAMVCSAAFALLRYAATWIVLLRAKGGPIFTGKLFVTQFMYAAPFGAAMVLSFPQQAAHQYAVSASVSPEMFAIYAIGVFQLPLVDLFYTPTSEVLMVRIGELEKQKRLDLAMESFREAASKLSLLFLPMVAFLFAAAPEFISACFGAKFLPAVPIFRVGIWSIALACLPMDGVLRARNSTRHIFWSYFIKTAVTVPLVYFLVKNYGMMGGIWSWLIAEIVGKAALLVRVPFALSAPDKHRTLREIIPWRNVGKAGIAALAAGLAVFALRRLIPYAAPHALPDSLVARVVPLLIATALFGVGYLAVLRVQGVRPFAVFSVLLRRRTATA